MSEIMEKIIASKREQRKQIATLPIEQKLEIMEKLRDRELQIKRPATVSVVGGTVVAVSGVQIAASMIPGGHQLPDQSNIHQISKTLSAELRKQPERWLIESAGV